MADRKGKDYIYGNVSTGVLVKNKEHNLRVKIKQKGQKTVFILIGF